MESLLEKRKKKRKAKTKKIIITSVLALSIGFSSTVTYATTSQNEFAVALQKPVQEFVDRVIYQMQVQMDAIKAAKIAEVEKTVEESHTIMINNVNTYAAQELQRYNQEISAYTEERQRAVREEYARIEEAKKRKIKEENDKKIVKEKEKVDTQNPMPSEDDKKDKKDNEVENKD